MSFFFDPIGLIPFPISLVKSDWKLQQKIPAHARPAFQQLPFGFPRRAMLAVKIDFHDAGIFFVEKNEKR